MKKKALVIGGLAVTTALAGGWALAQTVGTDLGASVPRSCMAKALMAWAPA